LITSFQAAVQQQSTATAAKSIARQFGSVVQAEEGGSLVGLRLAAELRWLGHHSSTCSE
jgi:hypothetical protein